MIPRAKLYITEKYNVGTHVHFARRSADFSTLKVLKISLTHKKNYTNQYNNYDRNRCTIRIDYRQSGSSPFIVYKQSASENNDASPRFQGIRSFRRRNTKRKWVPHGYILFSPWSGSWWWVLLCWPCPAQTFSELHRICEQDQHTHAWYDHVVLSKPTYIVTH